MCIYKYIYITYIPHLLYQSSVDEHLGCFYVLEIVNNAAMNTEGHISFQGSVSGFFFLDMYPGVELLGHMIAVVLEELPYCFPWWLYQYRFPPASVQGFTFPHIH